jgi:hypothetical protein
MKTRFCRIGRMSLALGLLAATSYAHAQSPRPWVDPPSENGASAPSSRPAPAEAKKPDTAQPSSSTGTSTATKTEEAKREPVSRRTEEVSSATDKPVSRNTPKRIVTERKDRQQTRAVATRSEQPRQTIQRRELAEQSVRSARAARVREGLNSGLQVMTLRTIEFPDGRRVQILTRPEPETMSELLGSPQ